LQPDTQTSQYNSFTAYEPHLKAWENAFFLTT